MLSTIRKGNATSITLRISVFQDCELCPLFCCDQKCVLRKERLSESGTHMTYHLLKMTGLLLQH